MTKTHRWRWLALPPLAMLAAWLIALPRIAPGTTGLADAAVDCRIDACAQAPQASTPFIPLYPPYPAPQVDAAVPPAEPAPTF